MNNDLLSGLLGGGSGGDTSKEFGRSTATATIGNVSHGSSSPDWMPWAVAGISAVLLFVVLLFHHK